MRMWIRIAQMIWIGSLRRLTPRRGNFWAMRRKDSPRLSLAVPSILGRKSAGAV